MSQHYATVDWKRAENEAFIDNKYSRAHQWEFDGGSTVHASASPVIVPLPYSVAENIDPEEAYIASISSCHMLFFLSLAVKNKLIVNRYRDEAQGVMKKNKQGKLFVATVTLRPKVEFSDDTPVTQQIIETLHHESHERCFIANSVKTEIRVEGE